MKHKFITLIAASVLICSYMPSQAAADAPQLASLQIVLANSNITVGEPLILKYKVTNPEPQTLSINVDSEDNEWINMKLTNAAGQSVEAPASTSNGRIRHHGGILISGNSDATGYLMVSQKIAPTQPGQYVLELSTHLVASWAGKPTEKSVGDTTYSLPVTVTEKDSSRLHTAAESLRREALRGTNFPEGKAAVKALFSMPEIESLSVWRELALDPNLDAFSATDVINQLAKLDSANTADILADMNSIAPERWVRTGTSPFNALTIMRQTARPELKQYINTLLTDSGLPVNNAQRGEVN